MPNIPFPTYVDTTAWNIPPAVRDRFPGEDSILARYARVLNGVEINSSFYKDLQAKTYARRAEESFEISRAIVAPEVCPSNYSASPQNGVTYVRLHGTPTIYESRRYPIETIDAVAGMIDAPNKPQPAWCIFDNTKYCYATENALELIERLCGLAQAKL